MSRNNSSVSLSDVGIPEGLNSLLVTVRHHSFRTWPGDGSLYNPYRETDEFRSNAKDFPQTFAQVAIDASAQPGYEFINWNSTSIIQQLGMGSPFDDRLKYLHSYFRFADGTGLREGETIVTQSYRGKNNNLLSSDQDKKADSVVFGLLGGDPDPYHYDYYDRLDYINYDCLLRSFPTFTMMLIVIIVTFLRLTRAASEAIHPTNTETVLELRRTIYPGSRLQHDH
mgnify:CR=1 FL=1